MKQASSLCGRKQSTGMPCLLWMIMSLLCSWSASGSNVATLMWMCAVFEQAVHLGCTSATCSFLIWVWSRRRDVISANTVHPRLHCSNLLSKHPAQLTYAQTRWAAEPALLSVPLGCVNAQLGSTGYETTCWQSSLWLFLPSRPLLFCGQCLAHLSHLKQISKQGKKEI